MIAHIHRLLWGCVSNILVELSTGGNGNFSIAVVPILGQILLVAVVHGLVDVHGANCWSFLAIV